MLQMDANLNIQVIYRNIKKIALGLFFVGLVLLLNGCDSSKLDVAQIDEIMIYKFSVPNGKEVGLVVEEEKIHEIVTFLENLSKTEKATDENNLTLYVGNSHKWIELYCQGNVVRTYEINGDDFVKVSEGKIEDKFPEKDNYNEEGWEQKYIQDWYVMLEEESIQWKEYMENIKFEVWEE